MGAAGGGGGPTGFTYYGASSYARSSGHGGGNCTAPADIAEGDTLFFVAFGAFSFQGVTAATLPTDATSIFGASGGVRRIVVGYKIATAADEVKASWNFPGGYRGWILRCAGWSPVGLTYAQKANSNQDWNHIYNTNFNFTGDDGIGFYFSVYETGSGKLPSGITQMEKGYGVNTKWELSVGYTLATGNRGSMSQSGLGDSAFTEFQYSNP